MDGYGKKSKGNMGLLNTAKRCGAGLPRITVSAGQMLLIGRTQVRNESKKKYYGVAVTGALTPHSNTLSSNASICSAGSLLS